MVIAGNAGKKSVSLKRKPAAKTAAPRTQAKSEAKSAGGGDTTTTTATADKDGGLKQLRMDDYVVSYTHSMDDGDDHSASAPARAAAAAAQKPLGGFQSARSMVKPDGEGTEAARACKSTSGSDEDEDEQAASDDALSGTVAAIRLDETQEQISKMDINRPLLIVAGAGSGKTTTLCARVIEMLRQGVAAQQILVITFTNKAADELKHRIRQYTRAAGIPQATAAEGMPYASTFHSWCYTLVAQHYRHLGWSRMPMVAAAESEHLAVAAAAMRDLENCRKLRQCEQMLGVSGDPADADQGDPAIADDVYVHDGEARWALVAEHTRAKTGFTVAPPEDTDDSVAAEKGARSRKFGAKVQAQAQQRAASDALYAHLYAQLGQPQGLRNLDSDAEKLSFGREFPGKDVLRAAMSFIYSAKARGDTPQMFPGLAGSLLAAYNGTLRRFGLVDFDDLLFYAGTVLQLPHVLHSVRSRFPYLLVDEFQDLNQLQMSLVVRLQAGVGRVTAVGDERQSIFAFRGASCEHNFAQFLSVFVDATVSRVGQHTKATEKQHEEMEAIEEDPERGVMASLTRNYRSHQSIVDLGNIVARDTGRGSALLERLRVPLTAQPTAPVVPVAVWANRTIHDEARVIVRRIAALLASGDCRPADIAIVSRVLNFGSYRPTELVEKELLRQGIAFVVRGGSSALKSQRMQHMMALVRCVANVRDDVAADTCLDAFVRDVGPAARKRIVEYAQGSSLRQLPLFERMRRVSALTSLAAGGLQKNARAALAEFVARVDAWREQIKKKKESTVTLRQFVRDLYDAYLANDVAEQPEDNRAPVGQKKLPPDALWEMVDAILDSLRTAPGMETSEIAHQAEDDGDEDAGGMFLADPDAACSPMALNAFAAQLCLLSSSSEDQGRVTSPEDPKKDAKKKQKPQAVVITTVHQAKGLEWEHVFIPHFIENILPMGFRAPPEADSKKRQLSHAEMEEYRTQHFREEGRLAYVAITRARRGLYISTLEEYPVFWMGKFFDGDCRPSRYLPDIMQPESKSKKYAAVESYDDDEEYFDSEDEDDPRSKNYHKNIVYGYSKKSRSNWYRRNNYKSRK